MGCFQLWDDRSSSAQPTGRAVVQEVTRPFLPLVWYRKGARKSFPFQVHNIYTYPCQLLPGGFPAYARVFHPAYLSGPEVQPVRWSTVASWTGRTVHPLMQFERVASLSEDINDMHRDPPWGHRPQEGSIPEEECQTLMNVLRGYTSTPDRCFFSLWEGYGNIDDRLYPRGARVKGRGRDYLLFCGPLQEVMSFLDEGAFPFWGYSANIWWPEDRAWCVATDIDLYDTYVGGSRECIEAMLDNPDLEAFPPVLMPG